MREEKNIKEPGSKNIKSVADQIEATQTLHYVMLADILIRYIEITLGKNDLTRLQGVALHNLVRKGGGLTPTELAKAMFRSKHSMTKIIDTLEQRGYVVRNGNLEDRRSTPIQITSNGIRCVKQDIKRGDIWLRKAIDVLDDSEKELFANMADRIYKNIIEIINRIQSNDKIK